MSGTSLQVLNGGGGTNLPIFSEEMTFDETMRLCGVLAKSGYFADAREASQAVVKVIAGRELGIPAVAAMTGIYIVKGRVSLSANLMAGAVKRSGRYTYRVKQHDDKVCSIDFLERVDGQWEHIGNSIFTEADARRAETQNLQKFPRNMLFARAMSNGVKWYCPDVFQGPVYTPEELRGGIEEDGETERPYVDAVASPAPETTPQLPSTPSETPASGELQVEAWNAALAHHKGHGGNTIKWIKATYGKTVPTLTTAECEEIIRQFSVTPIIEDDEEILEADLVDEAEDEDPFDEDEEPESGGLDALLETGLFSDVPTANGLSDAAARFPR